MNKKKKERLAPMTLRNTFTKSGARVHIHFGKDLTTNLWGPWVVVTDMALKAQLKTCYTEADFQAAQAAYATTFQTLTKPYKRPKPSAAASSAQPSQPAPQGPGAPGAPTCESTPETTPEPTPDPVPETTPEPVNQPNDNAIRLFRIDAVNNMQKFFSEFKFNPAARFVNTAARQASPYEVKQYVTGYVKLINNVDANDIIEKLKSPEFDQIATDLIKYPPTKRINTRLDIYFGDAGTGKTTKAIDEYPNADIVPCNASMLPDELMRTFDFNDENGNPVFKPSSLRLAMEAGKPIIFDEINLLSFDCLRLLQTLTDGKSTINYNGDTIAVKEGFKIIGTMNLVVNDQVYNLPEPLVDRADKIKEFKLSVDELTAYAF